MQYGFFGNVYFLFFAQNTSLEIVLFLQDSSWFSWDPDGISGSFLRIPNPAETYATVAQTVRRISAETAQKVRLLRAGQWLCYRSRVLCRDSSTAAPMPMSLAPSSAAVISG